MVNTKKRLNKAFAGLLAVVIAVGGAVFIDVESDVLQDGIASVVYRGLGGLPFRAALEAVIRPYAAAICVFVLPIFLERRGQALLGSRERGILLGRYALLAAIILAGLWRSPLCPH